MWFLTPQANLGAFSTRSKKGYFSAQSVMWWALGPPFLFAQPSVAMWNTEPQCSVELNRSDLKGPGQFLFPLATARIMSQKVLGPAHQKTT